MSDLPAAEVENRYPECETCGCEKSWVDCWNGCDDGYFDEYELDAINFIEGECFELCNVCEGKGGYYVCGNCFPAAVLR